MRWAVAATPIGPVSIGVTGDGVRAVRLPPPDHRTTAAGGPGDVGGTGSDHGGVLGEAVAQLLAYFGGERTGFALPLAVPAGSGTDFERAVWAELGRIPFGQTRTYGEVAAAVRSAGDARAVGTACNRNPLPLLVPCHRVVGAGGKLVGFGGGLAAKRWLLEHEASVSMREDWGPGG